MNECICMGFSINKMCVVHGFPETVRANEMIRVKKTVNGEIKKLKEQLNQEKQRREDAEQTLRLIFKNTDTEGYNKAVCECHFEKYNNSLSI